MRITVTEHQLHHEELRFRQSGQDFWAYHKRFLRITRTEKLAAVAIYSRYREGGGISGPDFGRLAKIVATELSRRGVTRLEVVPSKYHDCGDKMYRIDEWAAYNHRFATVPQVEMVAI